jgi:hypothetical protein
VTVSVRSPLEDFDPMILELLRLAAEVILAHPEAVPPALCDLCDDRADGLAAALTDTPPSEHREPRELLRGRPVVTAGAALIAGSPAGAATS